jgi:hypothetical protein
VLIDREFRCSNVRGQSLLEICRRNGLLGELRTLDFQELARQDERVLPLTRPNTCMGTVYANTKELAVWRENLTMGNGVTQRSLIWKKRVKEKGMI